MESFLFLFARLQLEIDVMNNKNGSFRPAPFILHRLSSSAIEGEPESCRDGLVMFIIGPPDFPEC
ncbi:hypothetical protein AC369_24830 [Salmonella enterica subsp. diarizonae]|nr:hypothetical protein [Salmonella enterica subsp. diarizonae]